MPKVPTKRKGKTYSYTATINTSEMWNRGIYYQLRGIFWLLVIVVVLDIIKLAL